RQMKHADKIIERILFLEGLPNLQHLGKLYIGQHTEEVLQCDIRKVKENIEAIRKAVALAETEQDYVTRDLVQEILEKEEEYWDWLDTQIDLIGSVGIENYIQSQM
ncbi:bacterioferritin, partial [Acinetobacter baumannii]